MSAPGPSRGLARRVLIDGALRPLAAAAWHAAVAIEARVAMRIGPAPRPAGDELTAVIKTFERPACCAALIASLRRFHPGLAIVVVDDSRVPGDYPGAEVVPLPFDSGVGAGRAAGLERVQTEFVVNLDDDFLCWSHSRLAEAVDLLRDHAELDLIGGLVIDLPLLITQDASAGGLHAHDRRAKIAPGTRFGPVEVADKVTNFFVARTAAVRRVGWDPALKRLDHADFFTRAKGSIVSGLWRELSILHRRDPFAAAYLKHRFDVAADYALLDRRYPG